MLQNRDILYIVAFLLLILALWTGLALLPVPGVEHLLYTEGGYDLTAFDFSDAVYVAAPVWDSWAEKLYAPEELDRAEEPVPHESLDFTRVRFATHRLRISLPPGSVYAIHLYSSGYSMRLFINGEEADTVGTPGTSREETVPLVRDATYYFTPRGSVTEVVVQTANFVHREGCRAPVVHIGTAENITRYVRKNDMETGLVFGCLMTASLYHLAIFLINRRRTASLVFSVLCSLLAYISNDFPALLLPRYNWHIVIRLEYLTSVMAAAALTLMVHILFPGSLKRRVLCGYLAVCAAYSATVICTDSAFFSELLTGFQILSVAMIVYSLTYLAITLRNKNVKNMLAFTGIAIFGVLIIVELFNRHNANLAAPGGAVGVGMMILIFCYTLVLSIENAETDRKLDEANRNEQEIRETNRMMERLDRLRTNFFANITHEFKTPLTVIKGYALLAADSVGDGDAETRENLRHAAREAQRLSDLAAGLLKVSATADAVTHYEERDLRDILGYAAVACRQIAAKNNNRLEVRTDGELPRVRTSGDVIHQVLVNLISNAGRHTRDGVISLTAAPGGDNRQPFVTVTVTDNGRGIPPDLLPRVFERRVSGSGSDGLGLTICKEIVEAHGGSITITSSGRGTQVAFTIPAAQGGDRP